MPELTHAEQVRKELPVTTKSIYLNTGTFGPLPICAIAAQQQQIQRELEQGRLGASSFEHMSEIYQIARQAVAHLLSADEDEIALTDNTTEGLNIICYGLHWQAGDEIITTNHEHIGLLAPLYQLRERYGVTLRIADLGPNAERPAAEIITGLITSRTRLIALSHVTWTTGARLDINEIGRAGRERGIPVLIDGAQSAGAIPLDLHTLNIDFYALPGQKWLCGPDGTGALYARRGALSSVTSTYVGYASTKDIHAEIWSISDDARRFEIGGRQTAAIAAQGAALNWLEKTVGYPWLFEHIHSLNTFASKALLSVPGLKLLSPDPGDSGLLAFTLAGQDPTEVVTQLREQYSIYTRTVPEMASIRISTGFFNTEAEITTLVKALEELVKR
jgi:L-cysteine/cystine lyase